MPSLINEVKSEEYYGNRDEMIKYIPANAGTVLDVGCGGGHFGRNLQRLRNLEVWGLELNKDAAEKAKTKLYKVIIGDIEGDDFSLPENYFDCIVFNDVLEHLLLPWRVLTKIKSYLKSDGWIVASIPNIRYFECIKSLLLHKEWEYADYGVMDRTHLRFFTINSIKKMFEDSGYSIITLEGIHYSKFSWKFNLLNRVLQNRLDDMRYERFVCVAKMWGR
jgi:2-polyprenyl-3-methyl-5-hydroxy-6-metoxy-1,4-benzoquinol methylase